MKAIVFDRFGGPEVLRVTDLPDPTPDEGEVVVEVAAATVNPTDLLMRSGQQAGLMTTQTPPYIAGMEFAGTVRAVGVGVPPRLQPGQPVMGIVNPRRPQGGAHARLVRAPAASVVALPPGIELVGAATVPMNGLTARMCLDALGATPGARVLVTGGAGAVGAYVIALAREAGLHVVADAKDSDRDFLRALGAAEIVPRGLGLASALQALQPQGMDAVVDGALLGDTAAAALRDGGTFVSLRRTQVLADPRVRRVTIGVLEQAANTALLEGLVTAHAQGVLAARVAHRFAPAQAGQAHETLERGGLRGRVVLVF